MDNIMSKNSAVEWLYNIMYKHKGNITISEFDQAKIMEKQQKIDAYEKGKKYKKPIKDSNPI